MLKRLRDAVSISDEDDTTRFLRCRIADLDTAVTARVKLDGAVAEAGLGADTIERFDELAYGALVIGC